MAALVPGALPDSANDQHPGSRSREFRCGRCCCSAPPRWRSASRACSEPPLPRSACSPPVRRGRVYSSSSTGGPGRRCCRERHSARSAEVDVCHDRAVDGGDDGRYVRAAVRPAAAQDMVPAAAGFFGAVLAVGWTLSEIASASVSRARTIVRLVAAAPVVVAVGLALGALVLGDDASWPLIDGVGDRAAHRRLRRRRRVAPSVGVDHGRGRRSGGGRHRCGRNQHRAADLWRVRGRTGGHRREHVTDRRRRGAARWLFIVFAVLAASGFVGLVSRDARSLGSVEWMPSPPAN